MYIYIYIERERERSRDSKGDSVYTYIHLGGLLTPLRAAEVVYRRACECVRAAFAAAAFAGAAAFCCCWCCCCSVAAAELHIFCMLPIDKDPLMNVV